jgi:hypothetical protein
VKTISTKTGLAELLEKAAVAHDVPLSLLEKILNEERARLYLFHSRRSSVLEDIRKMIQEATQKRE